MTSIQIVIIDRHPLVREALKEYFESHVGFAVVGTAHGLPSVLSQLPRWQPDLIIVDVALDSLPTTAATFPHLRACCPAAHVILISAEHAALNLARQIMDADGYVSKYDEPGVLMASIQAILQTDSGEREALHLVRHYQPPLAA